MLNEIVKTYLEYNAFSGVILIAKDNQIIAKEAFGFANLNHSILNSIKTRFHIASISKIFTAISIMQMIEKGKLSLNTTLDTYLPNIANSHLITIEHLMRHRSGLPNVNLQANYDNLSKIGISLEGLIQSFETYKVNFEPGDQYQYSNTNYNILAYLIEIISGKNFSDYLDEMIFKPLNMLDTIHRSNPEIIIPNLAQGYQPDGIRGLKMSQYLDWSVKTGNGSLVSTVDDLYKLDRALYTEKLISKKSYELMKDKRMGIFYQKLEGNNLIYINGRSPGYTARFNQFPDHNICIIILSNNYTAVVVDEISKRIAGKFLGFETDIVKIKEPVNLLKTELDMRSGNYRFDEHYFVPNMEFELKNNGSGWDYIALRSTSLLFPISKTTFFSRIYWATGGFEDEKFYFEFNGKKYYAKKISSLK